MSFATADQQKELTLDDPHKIIDLNGHTVYLFPLYGMTVDEITPDDSKQQDKFYDSGQCTLTMTATETHGLNTN